ncbi:MAG: aldehyde dehydrogenase [Gammaproteobacteria bacterium]|nr:MAG: aldehyde dehydrogenase [Gammaproteobacteria bacterium]
MKHYQMYIDGEWCDAADGAKLESINPATGKVWATAAVAGEAEVNRAVGAASRALKQGPWATMNATQRGKLLHKLGDLIGENAQMLGEIETIDSGKLAKETRAQTGYVSDYYYYYAGLADKIQGATLPIDKPDMHVYTKRVPIGVVAAVVPWNAQMFLTATKLGPALAAGNTVVLKASEQAPAPMFEFARLVDQAGFPAGVVNVITGYGEPCGRLLTSHPDVNRVAFTGGPETARHIVRNTAENFAVLSLELGGKSPIVIFEDADIESAVNGVIAGNFGAAGQSCVAGSRVFIQSSIREDFLALLVERAKQIRIGDPLSEDTQVGPLATQAQLDHITESVADAIREGATLLCGGVRPEGFDQGWYFTPTILDCPNQQIRTVREEMFGPVLSALSFDTEEEAIELANDSKFGLGAGIFTRDIGRAIRVSDAIHSGIIWVNTYRVISPIAPFGGFKQSGSGRESGIDTINDYTRTKTVWINTSTEPMADPFVMR